jgi:large conductance mechanosensitive channel
MLKDFKDFLLKHQVIGLATGVIIGAAVGKMVSSLVADVIMPMISPLIPGGEWRTAKLVLSTTTGADGKTVVNAVNYGNFLGTIVDFVVIAFCVYMILKAVVREAPPAPPPPSKTCPKCTETVALAATKCKFCTAEI